MAVPILDLSSNFFLVSAFPVFCLRASRLAGEFGGIGCGKGVKGIVGSEFTLLSRIGYLKLTAGVHSR